ncbi:hypothetical protein ACFORG_12910 [Lutimaribacter marinistellae]|uniref:Uncharacterized protein n=1 Tax=Lutimaribacter marinistellae TaxID=1820329 RepID=A0ABV7THY7_9RHOB
MPNDSGHRIVLIIGSAPDAVRCRAWSKSRFHRIVAINNAWQVRSDWDDHIAPDDFPKARMPGRTTARQRLIRSADYVPANNTFGGVFYAGGTMAFTTGYWALSALRPTILAFIGCDMIYSGSGKTHFYGRGAPDPLRDDPSLRSLEAKSARLLLHAARLGCACVRLSSGDSRLLFPSVDIDELESRTAPVVTGTNPLFDEARALEGQLGYRYETGRYWEGTDTVSAEKIDALDDLWLRAARMPIML